MWTRRFSHSSWGVQERGYSCSPACLWSWAGCHDEDRHQGHEGSGLEVGRSGTLMILYKQLLECPSEWPKNHRKALCLICESLMICPGWTCTWLRSGHWRTWWGRLDQGSVGHKQHKLLQDGQGRQIRPQTCRTTTTYSTPHWGLRHRGWYRSVYKLTPHSIWVPQ